MTQIPQITNWIKPRFVMVGVLSLLVAWIALWIGFHPYASVRHTFGKQVEQVPWVWVDAVSYSQLGTFEGELNLPSSRVLRLENTANAHLKLIIGGTLVYEGNGGDIRIPDSITSPVPFSLAYTMTTDFPVSGVIGLEEEILPNLWAVIPAWQFAPSNWLLDAVRVLFVVAFLGACLSLLLSLRLSKRHWVLILLFFAVAVAVRLLILVDKFNSDPTVWTMEHIWDNYVLMGRQWLGGTTHVGGQIFQQGTFIYWAMIQHLIGPWLQNLYLWHAIMGALVPILVMGAAWLLFGRTVGLTAGVLAVLYPPLIHYQLTLQDTGPLIVAISVLILALAYYLRTKSATMLIVIGAILGVGTLFRTTTLVLLLAVAGVVWLQPLTLLRRLFLLGMTTFVTFLLIMPVTTANFVVGVPALVSNLFDYQLFRSNNLDSVGLNTFDTQSEQLAVLRGDKWLYALTRETSRNPERLVELTARRLGLFWDSVEHADSGMVDYQTTGLDVSPLLKLLTVGGLVTQWSLMVIACVGIGLGLLNPSKRIAMLIPTMLLGAYIFSLLPFYVIGRVRIPSTPILIILASFAVVEVFQTRSYLRTALLLLASIAVGLGMLWLVVTYPRPNFIAQTPTATIETRAQFGDALRLLGYAYYDTDYRAGGYLTFELVWQSLRQIDTDYIVSIRFADTKTGEIASSQDFTLGSLSVPSATTKRWGGNVTFYERYLLRLPDQHTGYDLYVGIFDPVTNKLLSVSEATHPVLADHVRLTAVAVDSASVGVAPPAPLAVWGNALMLSQASCTRDTENHTHVLLSWYINQHIPTNMTQFLHAIHGGELIAQRDAAPSAIASLDGFPIGTVFDTQWDVDSTADLIRVGFYDWEVNRWTITQHKLAAENNTLEIPCS